MLPVHDVMRLTPRHRTITPRMPTPTITHHQHPEQRQRRRPRPPPIIQHRRTRSDHPMHHTITRERIRSRLIQRTPRRRRIPPARRLEPRQRPQIPPQRRRHDRHHRVGLALLIDHLVIERRIIHRHVGLDRQLHMRTIPRRALTIMIRIEERQHIEQRIRPPPLHRPRIITTIEPDRRLDRAKGLAAGLGAGLAELHLALAWRCLDHVNRRRIATLALRDQTLARLVGFTNNQLVGQNFAMLLTGYSYKVGEVFGQPALIGGNLEYGNVWAERSDIDFGDAVLNGSAYFGIDSWIGPILLGTGVREGGEYTVFLEIGHAF